MTTTTTIAPYSLRYDALVHSIISDFLPHQDYLNYRAVCNWSQKSDLLHGINENLHNSLQPNLLIYKAKKLISREYDIEMVIELQEEFNLSDSDIAKLIYHKCIQEDKRIPLFELLIFRVPVYGIAYAKKFFKGSVMPAIYAHLDLKSSISTFVPVDGRTVRLQGQEAIDTITNYLYKVEIEYKDIPSYVSKSTEHAKQLAQRNNVRRAPQCVIDYIISHTCSMEVLAAGTGDRLLNAEYFHANRPSIPENECEHLIVYAEKTVRGRLIPELEKHILNSRWAYHYTHSKIIGYNRSLSLIP